MTNFIRSHTSTHTHISCDFLYLLNFPCVRLCSYTASVSSVTTLRCGVHSSKRSLLDSLRRELFAAVRSAWSRTCPTATYGEWEETQQCVWAAVVVIHVTSWLCLNPSEKPMFASKRSSSLVISQLNCYNVRAGKMFLLHTTITCLCWAHGADLMTSIHMLEWKQDKQLILGHALW